MNKEEWFCKDGINYISVEESNKRIKEATENVLKKIELLLKDNEYVVCKYCGTIAYGNGECHCKKSFKTDENWIIAIDLFIGELKASLKNSQQKSQDELSFDVTKNNVDSSHITADTNNQDVLKKIDELLEECRKHLRENPLNDYWIGKETSLEQVQASLKNSREKKDGE